MVIYGWATSFCKKIRTGIKELRGKEGAQRVSDRLSKVESGVYELREYMTRVSRAEWGIAIHAGALGSISHSHMEETLRHG